MKSRKIWSLGGAPQIRYRLVNPKTYQNTDYIHYPIKKTVLQRDRKRYTACSVTGTTLAKGACYVRGVLHEGAPYIRVPLLQEGSLAQEGEGGL